MLLRNITESKNGVSSGIFSWNPSLDGGLSLDGKPLTLEQKLSVVTTLPWKANTVQWMEESAVAKEMGGGKLARESS